MAFLGTRAGCILFSTYKNLPVVLLVKSNYSGKWEFPRGGVEKGESIKKAIIRELEEEAGIKVNNLKIFKAYEFEEYYATKKGNKIHYNIILTTSYIPKPIKGNPSDIKEISQAKWVPLHEAIKILYKDGQNEYIKALIKAYLILIRKGVL